MSRSADDDLRPRSWGERLWSGLSRRVGALGSGLRQRIPPERAAEAALDWLVRQGNERGLPRVPGEHLRSVVTTGHCVPTLLLCGERELARSWAHGLLEEWPRIRDAHQTPEIREEEWNALLRGLLAIEPELPEVHKAAHEVGERLWERLNSAEPLLPWSIPILREAARRWEEPKWLKRLQAAERQFNLMENWRGWKEVPSQFAAMIATFLDLGIASHAKTAASLLYPFDNRDGSVASMIGSKRCDSAEQAHLAKCLFRLADRARAERVLNWLLRRQERTGGFYYRYPRSWFKRPVESIWTAKFFLEACHWQVRTAFQEAGLHAADLPADIDPADGRWQAVRAWASEFARPGLRLADIGCGAGRFLQRLQEEFPKLKLTGIDVSSDLLDALPRGVKMRRGSLTQIPAESGAFDAVLCVEALEHALWPANAVRELCRVLKPGGPLLVIDKHADKRALSQCWPWERWFRPAELSAWLERDCTDVSVRELAHGAHAQPTGLFLGWTAIRKADAPAGPATSEDSGSEDSED